MSKWSSEWPIEPGHYWFYGTRYENEEPELCHIEVWKCQNGVAYVVRGSFMYQSEANGVWLPLETPELPK